jgi:hypothetical protein
LNLLTSFRCCLISTLLWAGAAASPSEYADHWPLTSTKKSIAVDAWISVTSLFVLDGQTLNVALLTRDQTGQAKPSIIKPKPRPRLGGSEAIADESQPPYNRRVDQALDFITSLLSEFSGQWNEARGAAEVQQWVHEIEAECVFNINKEDGRISIESITNAPASDDMQAIREEILNKSGASAGAAKPFKSSVVEIDRLGGFIRSLILPKIPDSLSDLPGDSLRIRILFKVVKNRKATPA